MTEEEWFACERHWLLLVLHLQTECKLFRRKRGRRKMRLLACTCCRRAWRYFSNPLTQEALEVSERFADGLVNEELRRDAEGKATLAAHTFWEASEQMEGAEWRKTRQLHSAAAGVQQTLASGPLFETTWNAISSIANILGQYGDDTSSWDEKWLIEMVTLVRELFGNPFRPITINPNWLTHTVRNLAQVAYEERILPLGELDTARLAILADALEESGCDNEDVLGHLRSRSPHVRGCHVVDLILGRD